MTQYSIRPKQAAIRAQAAVYFLHSTMTGCMIEDVFNVSKGIVLVSCLTITKYILLVCV